MMRISKALFWLLPAVLLLAACGGADLPPSDSPAGVPETGDDLERLRVGQMVYQAQCATCHGENGEGRPPTFPALAGSPSVTGDPIQVIDVVLHGRNGMPPFAGILTDEEVAGVVTYIRASWTNLAGPVTPETVQSVR
jgi:cytochrome c6